LFAQLSELLGQREVSVTVSSPDATVRDVLDALYAGHPELVSWSSRLAVAKNESYARHEDAVHDDDVLALIPPVSGG